MLTLVQLKALEGFYARTELMAQAEVNDSFALVWHKRDLCKASSSSVAVQSFAFGRSELANVEQFLHLLVGINFLWN